MSSPVIRSASSAPRRNVSVARSTSTSASRMGLPASRAMSRPSSSRRALMPGADLAQDPAALVGGQRAGDLERGDGRLDGLLVLGLGGVERRAGRRRRVGRVGDDERVGGLDPAAGEEDGVRLGAGDDGHGGGLLGDAGCGTVAIVHPRPADAATLERGTPRWRRYATDLRDAPARPARDARPPREARPRRDATGTTRTDAAEATAKQLVRLGDLQDRFWAEAKRSVLVVLQGIDAAGKDGTINKVMEAFNPQGCPVTSFKVPSAEELAHDYLWRVHKARPAQGRDRHLQSLALRGRPRRARPRPRPARRLVEALRPDQRVRADPHRERHDDRQVLPVDLEGRAARAVPGALRRPDEALEVLDGRPRRSASAGTTTRPPSTTRCRRPRPPGRRGTSSRPTASGSANLAVATILADTIADLKPAYPPVAPDLPPDLVIE